MPKGTKIFVVVGVIIIIACFVGMGIMLHGVSQNAKSRPSTSSSISDSYGHDKFDAITVAEKIVKDNLKSPSTAKFCSTSEAKISCSDNTWTVSGWVDAQNSFGATLRNNYTVKFTFTSSNKYTIDSCNIS